MRIWQFTSAFLFFTEDIVPDMLQLFPLKEINSRGNKRHNEHGHKPEGFIIKPGIDHVKKQK